MNAIHKARRTASRENELIKIKDVNPRNKKNALPYERRVQNESVGARTRDLRIKSPLLYQLSYTPMEQNSERGKMKMRVSGLEPETYGLKVRCSTN